MGDGIFREIDGFDDRSWITSKPGIHMDINKPFEERVKYSTMRREIVLDGDCYVLSILTKELWTGMCESHRVRSAFTNNGDDIEDQTLLLARNKPTLFLDLSTNPRFPVYAWTVIHNKPKTHMTMDIPDIPYRPLLIPLDKDHKVDTSMQKDNPDGTVVEGGQLSMVNTSKFRLLGHKNMKPVFENSGTHDQENLRWVWYKGFMIGLNPSLRFTPEELVNYELISELILDLGGGE